MQWAAAGRAQLYQVAGQGPSGRPENPDSLTSAWIQRAWLAAGIASIGVVAKRSKTPAPTPAQLKRVADAEVALTSLRRQLAAVNRKLVPLEHKRLYSTLSRAEALTAMSLDRQRRNIERQLRQGRPGNTIRTPSPKRPLSKRTRVRIVRGGLPSLGSR